MSFSLSGEDDEEDAVGVIMSDGIMEEYLAFDSRDKWVIVTEKQFSSR